MNVIKKIEGVKPIEVSANVCDTGWSQSDNVIIASPADFPDALSGTVIGIQLNAPILFEDVCTILFCNKLCYIII